MQTSPDESTTIAKSASPSAFPEEPKSCWQKSKPCVIVTAKYGACGVIGALFGLGLLFFVLWAMGLLGGSSDPPPSMVDLGELPYPSVKSDYTTLTVTMNPVPAALSYDPKYYIIQTQAASGGRRLRSATDGQWLNAVVVDYLVDQAATGVISDLSAGDSLVVRYKIEMADGRMSSPSIAVVASTTTPSAPDSGSLIAVTTTVDSVATQIVPPSNTGGSDIVSYTVQHVVGVALGPQSNYDDVEWTEQIVDAANATNPIVVAGLAAEEHVSFRVATKTAFGVGDFCLPYVMRSNSEGAVAPSQVDELGVRSTQAASIDLSWSAAADNGAMVLKYIITETGSGTVQSTDGSNTAYQVEGLQKDTEYTFTVQAENSEGLGEQSDSVTATTAEFCQADPAANLAVQTPFSDGFSIMWSPPNSPVCDMEITGYRVVMADTGDVLCEPVDNANWCDTSGLDQSTTYTVRVETRNEGGWSTNQSEELKATTVTTGVCTDMNSIRWWISTTNPYYDSQDFVYMLADCAAGSLGSSSGITKCTVKYTETPSNTPFNLNPLTEDCASCYGDNGACGANSCMTACKFGTDITSSKCIECNDKHCKPAFYECSGLYAGIAPPDPAPRS